MSVWMQLLYLVCAGLLIFFMIRTVRSNPQWFSKENMSNSFTVMGFLTIGLIAFIALLVFLLKHS